MLIVAMIVASTGTMLLASRVIGAEKNDGDAWRNVG
jgi:hypothetical protein